MDLPNYYRVLDEIHQTLYPRTYLEIGLFQGYALNLALPGTQVVGVDPDPRVISPLPDGAVIERTTSDEFFSSGRISTQLNGLPIDLAFIDGMHLWEYSLRDFLNVERCSAPDSIILVHDCLPHSAVMAGRQKSSGWWTGDVWKLLYFMREELPDLSVTIVDAPATGLGVIRNLNPNRGAIDVDAVISRYMDLEFSSFENDLLPSLRVVSSTSSELRAVLPEVPWQSTANMPALLADRGNRRRSARARSRAAGLRVSTSRPVRAGLRWRRRILR